MPIIPYLQDQHVEVERELERLRQEAEQGDAERHRQLAAIRYYLQYALGNLEQSWLRKAQGVTNYKTLLDQIRRSRKPEEQVCLVTFNYDTMLEAALISIGITIEKIQDYIASDEYKIIKVHGSVNWGREVNTYKREKPEWACFDLIKQAPDLDISDKYKIIPWSLAAELEGKAYFPALAIPVETKRSFECPNEHLKVLRQCAQQTSKLLIIGWRGMEDHFLQLLAEKLSPTVRTMTVNGSVDDVKQTLHRLAKAGIKINPVPPEPMKAGFSDFVVRRLGEEFLRS